MRARGTALTAGMLAVLLSAACGASPKEAGKPATQILQDAQSAARAADSVHISGTVARQGATATVDLVLTSSGDGRERISGAGQDIEIVKVGQTLYVKGLSAAGSGAPAGFRTLPVTDPQAAQLAAQLDKNAVFGQLIDPNDTPSVTGSQTIAGQQAITLTPRTGAGVLYVADDEAHPYPLKVETAGSPATSPGQASPAAAGPNGALMFTEWNAHTTITPPPSSGN